MEKNLTSGSVLKSILFFSLPYLLSYFLQTLYGMADLFIIGQFEGVASTTAVSIGSQVMHMITVMIVGLAMGATVTIGRAVGAENKPRAARLIGNTVTLFMAGSVVLAAVLVGLVDPIVRIVSTPEQAVAGTLGVELLAHLGGRLRRPPALPGLDEMPDMDHLEERLFALAQLKRKLHRTLPEILTLREEIAENLSFLDVCALDITQIGRAHV